MGHVYARMWLNAKETWETVNLLSSSSITIKFYFSCMRTYECFSVSKFLGVFFLEFYLDDYGEYDQ